jgi:tetratricopeptide (TPR) repeat protein
MVNLRTNLRNLIDQVLGELGAILNTSKDAGAWVGADFQATRNKLKVIASGYESARYYSEEGESKEGMVIDETDFSRLDRLGSFLCAQPPERLKRIDAGDIWFQLGELLFSLRKYLYAVKFFTAVVQCEPDNVVALRFLGEAYFYSDMDGDAIRTYRRALDLAPGDANTWFDLGRAYSFSGKDDEAARAFQTAILYDPTNEEISIQIGDNYLDTGDKKEAMIYYRKALDIDSKNSDAWLGVGLVLKQSSRKDAIDAMLKVIQYDPENGRGYMELACLLRDSGQRRAAFELLEKALNIDGVLEVIMDESYYEIWLEFAKSRVDKSDDCKVINAMRKAALSKQDDSFIWCYLGHLYKHMGDSPNAIKAYQRSTYIDSRNQEAWRYLAIALLETKQGAAAEAAVKKYNELVNELLVND